MLSFNNITKIYEDKKVVDNLSFNVEPGTIFGFLGPNGAGKTTAIKMSCGLVKPTFGDITAYDISLNKNYKQYIKNVGAVLEGNRNIYWRLTPGENMEYYAIMRGVKEKNLKSKINNYLELFSLSDKKKSICANLSRGMQQKVAICCSLIHDPQILFLDEPTLGLDVESVDSMEKILKELINRNRIIIITSHDLRFISSLCSKIAIINNGSLVVNEEIDFLKNYSNDLKYNIKLSYLDKTILRKFQERYKIKVDTSNEYTELIVYLKSYEDFVKLINQINDNGLQIIDIYKIETELKDVFMDIIRGNYKGGEDGAAELKVV